MKHRPMSRYSPKIRVVRLPSFQDGGPPQRPTHCTDIERGGIVMAVMGGDGWLET